MLVEKNYKYKVRVYQPTGKGARDANASKKREIHSQENINRKQVFLREGVRKNTIYLGLGPKLLVGGGQEPRLCRDMDMDMAYLTILSI